MFEVGVQEAEALRDQMNGFSSLSMTSPFWPKIHSLEEERETKSERERERERGGGGGGGGGMRDLLKQFRNGIGSEV
jgi:hypothetical protein